MITPPLQRWRRLRCSEQGSFTVEASLVMPVVFLCTVALLFFGLYMYQKVVLFHAAAVTADRTAAHWDNSYKDQRTGSFPVEHNDGLYWRVFDDNASDILGLIGLGNPAAVSLPVDPETERTGSGPEKKMKRAAGRLAPDIAGQIAYHNYWLDRQVDVQLSRLLNIPSLLRGWYDRNHTAGSSIARVTDPVELIRTVDLTRTYLKQLLDSRKVPEIKQTWRDFTPDQPAKVIESENKGSEYLMELLNGTDNTISFSTEPLGVRRIYNFLDRDGVAHDAKMNLKYKDALEQMKKDALLMERGDVKGVVWHFFRTKSGKLDLTPKMHKELTKHGVVVVVHN
ncbi:TadE family protein [Paenibacillus senegalensis]|uniref:TadE family protein n=1 Tax=Paenibacillus senegalensis TaxID=1465766 RepID=UPI0002893770|nr:TadE family protein [Paenibacillus senegalensis]